MTALPRVLVVEDDPEVQELVDQLLSESGYDVRICGVGTEAWPLLRELRPDVVILDLMLPGMGGLELLVRLRADRLLAKTPVLVWSGAHDDLVLLRDRLHRLGCATLEKPFDVEALERALRLLVSRDNNC